MATDAHDNFLTKENWIQAAWAGLDAAGLEVGAVDSDEKLKDLLVALQIWCDERRAKFDRFVHAAKLEFERRKENGWDWGAGPETPASAATRKT